MIRDLIDSTLLVPGILFFAYMSVLWLVALFTRNYGWVDFGWPSATGVMDLFALLLVPITAYWFLVHFTGIPITELASLQRRGQGYANYCTETNRFFPWLPTKNVEGANR